MYFSCTKEKQCKIAMVLLCLAQGPWASSLFGFDLTSAYHHIGIYEKHRDYLCFQWNDDAKTKFYVFNVLPFGVSVAAYIFTKITRVLISKGRSQGLRIVMYLDDGLCGDKGYDRTKDVSIQVKSWNNWGFYWLTKNVSGSQLEV